MNASRRALQRLALVRQAERNRRGAQLSWEIQSARLRTGELAANYRNDSPLSGQPVDNRENEKGLR